MADVLRRHGDAYRLAHAGHLGRVERRVMGAIVACRTAVLCGHVEACDDCGLERIAYIQEPEPRPQLPAPSSWSASWPPFGIISSAGFSAGIAMPAIGANGLQDCSRLGTGQNRLRLNAPLELLLQALDRVGLSAPTSIGSRADA
jgi:Transposase zinc-binding domain